jgi:hypothetical protein
VDIREGLCGGERKIIVRHKRISPEPANDQRQQDQGGRPRRPQSRQVRLVAASFVLAIVQKKEALSLSSSRSFLNSTLCVVQCILGSEITKPGALILDRFMIIYIFTLCYLFGALNWQNNIA